MFNPPERAADRLVDATEERILVFQNLFRSAERRETLDAESARQAGAIPYRVIDGQVVFLIVTSRRTGRWIFPKGAPIEGLSPPEVAAREAFQEAGVEGRIEENPVGSYSTVKVKGVRRIGLEVDLFPLAVETQHETWPETGQRHRHWVLLSDARRLLSDPVLGELATRLQARVLGGQATEGTRYEQPHPANALIKR